MTDCFTFAQAVAHVPGLTHTRLEAFIAADLVLPACAADVPSLCAADLARLQLLCELADHFDLDADALGVVIGLIDQLHDARQRLFAIAQAMEAEPQDLRARIGTRLIGLLAG